MIKRGTILRDTSAGPGLVAVDGQHFQFSSDTPCRLPDAAIPGMPVNVEFAADCRILSIAAVEQPRATSVLGSHSPALSKDGLPFSIVSRLGLANLSASLLLMIFWTLLTSMSVQTLFGKLNFSFWELLGFLNSGSGWEAVLEGRGGMSAGIYGLLALLIAAAPYVGMVWNDKRTSLCGVLPLLLMAYVGLMIRSSLYSAFGATAEGPLAEVQRQAQEEMMKAVSIGWGAVLAGLVCVYFAVAGIARFWRSGGAETEAPSQSDWTLAPLQKN